MKNYLRMRKWVFIIDIPASSWVSDDELDLLEEHERLWREGLAYFNTGISAFERAQDKMNVSLLCSNKARLMRLLAQASVRYTNHQRHEFTNTENAYFTKVLLFYHRLQVIAQPVWRSGQSVGLGIEMSWVRNSPVPSGSSLRPGN